MNVIVVMEGTMETGRGPLFRRLGMLSDLARSCKLTVVCLAEPDSEVRRRLRECGVAYVVHPARFEGWSVTNADQIVSGVVAEAASRDAELVVLDWEIWDLMRELSKALLPYGVRFATVIHAVPFLNTPVTPSGDFFADVNCRLHAERDPAVISYIREHAQETFAVLSRMEVLAPNQCVVDYLATYFPRLPTRLLEPGYAIDLDQIDATTPDGPPVTFAYMARLVAEKGIYPLLEAFAEIVQIPDFEDSRLLLIGSFEEPSEELRFKALANDYGLLGRLEFAGWQRGLAKYRQLKRASVFLYPAQESDTFCICMLEALACGLPVVCADVPFSRSIYRTDAVTRCHPGDAKVFAQAATRLAVDRNARAQAQVFANHYGSWEAVALAEARSYVRDIRSATN